MFADSEVLIIFTCATERLLPLCMHCTHTPLSSRGQMHSFCLNFIADFSLICSPLPFLSGPVVIGLLLHTPSVSENEMSRMHYIPLETHVEQGDSPFFFFFTNDIESGKGKSVSCEITDHPGLSCFCSLRVTETVERNNTGKANGRCWAQHVFLIPHFFFSL